MLGALTVAGACLLAEVALTYFHFEWGGTDELIGTGMNYIHQVSRRDVNRLPSLFVGICLDKIKVGGWRLKFVSKG